MKRNDLLVVGIASSAGGLGPLRELIANAICHENMAFVLVPHLSRDHESALPNLIKKISHLKILTITDGISIEPCHLYILPPKFYARIDQNKIYLDPRPKNGINTAANHLFKSLASYYKKNAIGVVLSGAAVGADGSQGVEDIKKAGGHTYAQEPSTALFPGMPLAAINTGYVDSVLNPGQIGNDLSLVSWAT